VRVEVPAASIVVTEGQTSDRFYVIVSGEVQVTQAGRVLRVEGPGEFFGEIGLLRNVLRTATVTATVDSELLVLEQADFLAVVSHGGETVTAFDDVITGRLYA
jgi:CRP-like cAMP-binding protein